jgi:hypothetical protein
MRADALNPVHVISTTDALFGWALLRGLASIDAPVVLLGPRGDVERARGVAPGLRIVGSASGGAGRVRSTGLALRRELLGIGALRSPVVCWDALSFAAAEAALRGEGRALRVPEAFGYVPCAAGSMDGPDQERVGPADGCVIAALGAGEAVDAFAYARLAGVLSYAGESIVLVLPRDAAGLARAERFAQEHGQRWGMRVVDPVEPPHCSGATCALVWPVGRELGAALAGRVKSDVAAALACGVPVLAQGLSGDVLEGLDVRELPGDAPLPATVRTIRAMRADGSVPGCPERSLRDWREELVAWMDGAGVAGQGCC